MKYYALLGALVVAISCSGSDHGNIYISPSGGGNGSSGHTSSHAGASSGGHAGSAAHVGDAGEGGEAVAAGGDLAPVITISSPTAVPNPSTGTPLTGASVTVTCSATQSAAADSVAVLASSVKIQMFGADGKQVGMDGSVMATANANEYSSRFTLTGVVPSGSLSFVCSASDQSATPHSGKAVVNTFYDAGPVIALINPADKSAHSLGSILFKFSVLAAPLADGDQSAAVTDVTLSVNGVPISKITPLTNMPGYYQSDIDLSDPKLFSPKPVGSVPIAITATNKRGTKALQNFMFVVDSMGPIITVVSPPTTSVQFVGGQTTVQFTIVDEPGGSGVDPATVQVAINKGAAANYLEGNYWHLLADGKTFNYTFNTLDYPSQLGVTVKISAFDKAGNMALGTAPFYYLDNVPPIVDMQPPILQERTRSGMNEQCSEPFDPLGESPKDITSISGADKTTPSTNKFRALVWDVGNSVDGQDVSFYSDIDTAVGVRLYFQQDVTQPLLKNFQNKAGDICDQIADSSLPFISLTPVNPAGSAFYDKSAPIPPGVSCISGTDPTAPEPLCQGNTILTRVIQHEAAVTSTPVPVIYGFQPSAGSLCTGGQFDLTTVIKQDGWVCASVVAQDKIGNRSVSAPLRFCLDALDSAGTSYKGKPPCATGANPPTCVAPPPAGCIPPPHFKATVIEKL